MKKKPDGRRVRKKRERKEGRKLAAAAASDSKQQIPLVLLHLRVRINTLSGLLGLSLSPRVIMATTVVSLTRTSLSMVHVEIDKASESAHAPLVSAARNLAI